MIVCFLPHKSIVVRCISSIYFFLIQQQPPELEQSQVGSVPRNSPLIMPAAQPTPDFTVIAAVEQFIAQAPHSIQKSLRLMNAFFSFTINTA